MARLFEPSAQDIHILYPGAYYHYYYQVAAASAGMSGAELANLVNEAAITAVREGHAQV